MTGRIFLALAAASGAISVGVDAAARHLLDGAAERLDFALTAARYGLVHAAALLAIALTLRDAPARGSIAIAGWLFVAGLVLFCGSLDLVAAGAPRGLTALTPWGGSAFIAGWVALLIAALRPRRAG